MKSLLLLTFSSFISICFSQAIEVQWTQLQGGIGFDNGANDAMQTSDGGFIYNSTVNSGSSGDIVGAHGGQDSWLVKTDQAGNIEWQRPLGGPGTDNGNGVVETADGGFITVGSSTSDTNDVSFNWGDYDIWVAKVDSQGVLQWDISIGGTAQDMGEGICLNADGSVAVTGSTKSSNGSITNNQGLGDLVVSKISASGTMIWTNTYGGTSVDNGDDIQTTSDGGYIVVGNTYSDDGDVTSNAGFYDFWILKLDSVGTLEWQQTYGGSQKDDAYSVQQTTDGGYIVVGSTESIDGDISNPLGDYDIWVLKLDANGLLEWEKSLGGSDYDEGLSVIQTSTNKYLIAGLTYSNDIDVSGNQGGLDAWVVVLDSVGNMLDQRCIGGSDDDLGISINENSNGTFIFAGGSSSNDGDVSGNNGNRDIFLAKLRILSTVELAENERFSIEAYPNPSSDYFWLNCDQELIGSTYKLVDNIGKTVRTGSIQNTRTSISTNNFDSGMYYLSVDQIPGSIKVMVE